MTTREKNLLAFLGVALFIILNFVAYTNFYSPQIRKAESAVQAAESKRKAAEQVLALSEEYEPEIKWLERSGVAETTPQVAQSKLQALIRKQASARKLEVRDSRILPFQGGEHYDRVRVLFKVTGMERDVFSWLTSIHLVNQRQVVTKMEIRPKKSDIHRIECQVEVEKWIITPTEVTP